MRQYKWHLLGALSAVLALLPLACFAIAVVFTGEALTPGSAESNFFAGLKVVFLAGRFTGPIAVILGIICVWKGSSALGTLGIIVGFVSAVVAWQSWYDHRQSASDILEGLFDRYARCLEYEDRGTSTVTYTNDGRSAGFEAAFRRGRSLKLIARPGDSTGISTLTWGGKTASIKHGSSSRTHKKLMDAVLEQSSADAKTSLLVPLILIGQSDFDKLKGFATGEMTMRDDERNGRLQTVVVVPMVPEMFRSLGSEARGFAEFTIDAQSQCLVKYRYVSDGYNLTIEYDSVRVVDADGTTHAVPDRQAKPAE